MRKVLNKQNKKKIILNLVTILLLLISCLSVFYIIHIPKNNKEKVNIKVKIEKPKVLQANLIMVGDALIHSAVYDDAKNIDGTYDFKPMLENIKPIISKYDLAYYNQETILGGKELGYSTYPRFNSPNEVGDAFLDAGFNMVSLATNHTMDMGEAGVINSVNYWKSKENVVKSGQWTSSTEREQDINKVYEINGIKYAFISYTTWTNGLENPPGKEYLNNVYSNELAKSDIEKVKDKVDVIIVAMHWGTEYSHDISPEQEEIANYLSELGVDLIIGAHPHVIEPVEYINNGKTFVIYSLGNFLSAQLTTDTLTGLMMEVTIKKIENDGKTTIKIVEPKADLVYTKSNGITNYKLYPYKNLDNTILPNYQAYYEDFKNLVGSRYSNINWTLTGE